MSLTENPGGPLFLQKQKCAVTKGVFPGTKSRGTLFPAKTKVRRHQGGILILRTTLDHSEGRRIVRVHLVLI